jgi:two-component system sporulation sensor kinase C
MRRNEADPLNSSDPDDHIEDPKTQMGICLSDPANRRLVGGVAAQLGLIPLLLEESDLDLPEQIKTVELLIVDEVCAQRLGRASGLENDSSDSLPPAIVAAVSDSTLAPPFLPHRAFKQPYDGVLVLPQQPMMVLAQLSVILYAHRAHLYRFENALKELHLNRRIFRSVTSGVVVSSATEPDYPVTYVNPAFEVITGYSLKEAVGKNCRFLQGSDRNQPGLTSIREALQEQREIITIVRNYRKDGSIFWNELSLSPIRDAAGKVTHVVSIQTDVSSRIAFEEALIESEKLATAGRLAASIAHEINNPLASVTNLVFLARAKCQDTEVAGFLDLADQELKRVSQLTTQSLRFYRQSTAPQPVRPAELISSILELYETKFVKGAITVQRRDSPCGPVMCLESEIRQVVSNLIRNAVDAMSGASGKLTVRTREATEWRSGASGVVITVADTGIGMAPQIVAKIYKAFYTTKGSAGTGLGLWISSEIVERHRGHLRVRSRVQPGSSGTVFELFLPHQSPIN